jgi:uncharacterized cupredoxin-like copper-binding protein
MVVRSALVKVVVLVLAATVATVADVAAAGSASQRVSLRLKEYKISPTRASAGRGRVTLQVTNRGKETHEVLVVRGTRHLPTNGERVDEGALERSGRVVGEVADVKRGTTASRTFTLKRGTYVLLCNLPGHYKDGMHATLTVR